MCGKIFLKLVSWISVDFSTFRESGMRKSATGKNPFVSCKMLHFISGYLVEVFHWKNAKENIWKISQDPKKSYPTLLYENSEIRACGILCGSSTYWHSYKNTCKNTIRSGLNKNTFLKTQSLILERKTLSLKLFLCIPRDDIYLGRISFFIQSTQEAWRN